MNRRSYSDENITSEKVEPSVFSYLFFLRLLFLIPVIGLKKSDLQFAEKLLTSEKVD